MSLNLGDFKKCVELAFCEISDIKQLRYTECDEVVFNSRAISKYKRLPNEIEKIEWASLVTGRATGLHTDMFRNFEEMYKSKYNGINYFKGFKITIGSFVTIDNETINECLLKTSLLISEISNEYTLKIVKKHLAESSRHAYNYRHFHLCRIDRIEILILNLNEEFEILPLTSVLKAK
jgi:hypothetical protein